MKLYRKLLLLIGISVLVLHFTFTIIFNFNNLTHNITVRWIVFKYMFPVFNQNNKVFAPDPPFYKHYLTLQFHHKSGKWTAQKNVQTLLLNQFYNNRLSKAATQLKIQDYVFMKLYAAHLLVEYNLQKKHIPLTNDSARKTLLLKDEGYMTAVKYFSDYAKKNNQIQLLDSVKFCCNLVYPKKFNADKLNKIESSKLVINFPAAKLLTK